MISAQEARSKSEEVISAKESAIELQIHDSIQKACAIGNKECNVSFAIPPKIYSMMQMLGYKLDYTSYRNEANTNISWYE